MTTSDLADIAMTWSALKEMSRSPAHCRHKALLADGGEQTLAMRMGSGVAALTFGKPEVVVYQERRAGKAWEVLEAEAKERGAVILNPREHAQAMSIATALRRHPISGPLLFGEGVEVEVPMEWEVSGRKYRTRGIDFINRAAKYIGELKVARTTQPGRFERDQLRALYPAQVEFYDEGDAIVTGRDRDADPFKKYIVGVEPLAPFIVTVFELSPSAIRQARRTIALYRSQLATCEEANVWPGYSLAVVPFEVDESDYDAADDEEIALDAGAIESATFDDINATDPF